MKFAIFAIFAALCVSALAAEEPLRSKRQLLASYVASPYVASPYVASPYVASPYVASPYVSAPYVAASPYNGGASYSYSSYAPAYASAYYSPYAYL